jgi:hypothetical protein
MKRILMMVLVASAFLVLLPKAQQAQSPNKPNAPVVNPLVLYDNFNGRWIEPAKWDNWIEPSLMREAVRDLSPSYQGEGNNRRLRIFQRAYSSTDNDQDTSWGWLGLQFPNGGSITEISFDVLVNSAAITACQSNQALGNVAAQFRGRFFNTYGYWYGDAGDVEAAIEVARSATDASAPLEVNAFYYVGDGSTGDWRNVGYIRLGQTAKLRFKWDQPNHRFVAQLNKDPEVYLDYSIPDVSAPTWSFRGIQVTHGTPNCTTTPTALAMMDAYFDNVYVNAP